jgi:hypothetical protein
MNAHDQLVNGTTVINTTISVTKLNAGPARQRGVVSGGGELPPSVAKLRQALYHR